MDLPPASPAPSLILGGPLTGKTTRLVERYRQLMRRDLPVERILCLSFFSANSESIRRALRTERAEFFPGVTTLQRFQTLLLRDWAKRANLPARVREIDATTRALAMRQAWKDVNGPLWREFGERPGAVKELTKVIDWITQNRTRFVVAEGELGDHELAQVYGRYVGLCARHRLLTFQEASLRCLDLLADPAIAAEVAGRYPAVLVDDLHLARPDQLALVARLREGAAEFTATAWLEPDLEAPELKLIWRAVQGWGAREELGAPAPGVNHAITALAQRAAGKAAVSVVAGVTPVSLRTESTVEDELHAVAQSIARALLEDSTLEPADIVVAAASASLLPFAQRILADYGLPVAPLQPLPRHTPLIAGGLLALRWVREPKSRLDIERDLLALPYARLHPLDRSKLYNAAQKQEKTILTLELDERLALTDTPSTRATLDRARRSLEGLDAALPASQLIQTAVRDLGGVAWAWGDGPGEFSQAERDAWTSAYSAWLNHVAELETTADALGTQPADFVDLVAGLADTARENTPAGAVQLIDSARTNGVHARLAYVVGLSENATPLLQPEMQLATEDQLPGLFADGRAVTLPCAREHAAWIEREGRALAALLSRGHERLHVSLSRYSAGGEAQLPSPFFERLLGGEGEIEGDGNFKMTAARDAAAPGLWRADLPGFAGQTALEQVAGGLGQSKRAEPIEARVLRQAQDAQGDQPGTLRRRSFGSGAQVASSPESGEKVLIDHTFSASQMRMYLTCPLQYFYGKVLNIEAEEYAMFTRGSLLHELLCVTVGDGSREAVDLSRRKRPEWMNDQGRLNARAQAALRAAWAGEAADLPEGGRYTPGRDWGTEFGAGLQQQAVRRWAAGILEKWADYETSALPNRESRRPVLLEAMFTMTLGGYKITGRIDRVDEVRTGKGPAYEVLDYKTGWIGRDAVSKQIGKFLPPEGEEPTDYQLPLYALALGQGVGARPVRALPQAVSYYNLEGLEKGKRGGFGAAALRTITFGGKTLDTKGGTVPVGALTGEITDGIVKTLGQMSLSPYPAKPAYRNCQYCSFRAACDRGRAQREGDS